MDELDIMLIGALLTIVYLCLSPISFTDTKHGGDITITIGFLGAIFMLIAALTMLIYN